MNSLNESITFTQQEENSLLPKNLLTDLANEESKLNDEKKQTNVNIF